VPITEPKYMVAYFYAGESIGRAAKACIETAKINNCQVFLDFNGVYIPVTRSMDENTVVGLYHQLLAFHPEKKPEPQS